MKQYKQLLTSILEKGTYKEPAREGMPGTTSLFGHQFRHNLSDGFPLLTTKKMSFKIVLFELLWFLKGDTNIKFLVDNSVNIWNEDAYNYYLKQNKIYKDPYQYSFEDFIEAIKGEKKFVQGGYYKNGYQFGDCGFQYGKVWRDWEKVHHPSPYYVERVDQIQKVINNIREKPYDRRKVVTAVDPAHDEDLALYWCHCLFQFNCRRIDLSERVYLANLHEEHKILSSVEEIESAKKSLKEINFPEYYLDCQLYQRSCDVFLGVPYNIASYALLTHIIAKICNMVPGEFIHSFGDVHIYDNHKNQVLEQLQRDTETYKLPTLEIDSRGFNDLDSMFNAITFQGWKQIFQLKDYQSYPGIEGELSTGLKK